MILDELEDTSHTWWWIYIIVYMHVLYILSTSIEEFTHTPPASSQVIPFSYARRFLPTHSAQAAATTPEKSLRQIEELQA